MVRFSWLAIGIGLTAWSMLTGCERRAYAAIPPATQPTPSPAVVKPPPPTAPITTEFREISARSLDRRIPVLMYHNVVASEGDKRAWFDVTVHQFTEQLDWLQSKGWTPITPDTLYEHLVGGSLVPEKSVLLTFDDGYQGFYDYAYPILKVRNMPAAMFIHTGYVGRKDNSPKMGWEELKVLAKDGLVKIGSHTVSHPEDITKLSGKLIAEELGESKKTLEERLGIKVDFLAYPVGKNNSTVQTYVQQAGYKMAFTMEPGPAEESPNILAVNRTIESKYREACEAAERAAKDAPAGLVEVTISDQPLEVKNGVFNGQKVTMIMGGRPSTWLSAGRYPVGRIVSMAKAQAGINGGYFALSAISSDDDQMIGPCLASNQKVFKPDFYLPRLPKLKNRPLVVVSPTKFAILPFQPGTTNRESDLKRFMPDMTDVFMAGAWFVRDGRARPWSELKVYCAPDVNDYRRRAFLGVMKDGRVVIGAAIDSVSTPQLGSALVEAGVKEALLLDSGFSTSLVFGDKILASGHATPDKPSRPIPHSILLTSDVPPAPGNVAALAEIASERRVAGQGSGRRSRR